MWYRIYDTKQEFYATYFTVSALLSFCIVLLIMLVLYPVILFKLRQHRIPGNANRSQAIRRRKQNFRITMMFTVICTVFFLTWGPAVLYFAILYFRPTLIMNTCAFYHFHIASFIIVNVFYPINPIIYFIFCSSFRKGLKNLFSCGCCSTNEHQAAAGNVHIELCNLPH